MPGGELSTFTQNISCHPNDKSGRKAIFFPLHRRSNWDSDSNVPVYTMDSKFKLKISPFKVEWPSSFTVLQKLLNIMVSTMLATQKMKTSSVDTGGVKKYWFDWVIVDQFHFKRQSNVHLPVGWGGGRNVDSGKNREISQLIHSHFHICRLEFLLVLLLLLVKTKAHLSHNLPRYKDQDDGWQLFGSNHTCTVVPLVEFKFSLHFIQRRLFPTFI